MKLVRIYLADSFQIPGVGTEKTFGELDRMQKKPVLSFEEQKNGDVLVTILASKRAMLFHREAIVCRDYGPQP